jgi:hypothetical protein
MHFRAAILMFTSATRSAAFSALRVIEPAMIWDSAVQARDSVAHFAQYRTKLVWKAVRAHQLPAR